jgi:hypothetical protein
VYGFTAPQLARRVLRSHYTRTAATVLECPKGEFDIHVLQDDRPVIVDFHADW